MPNFNFQVHGLTDYNESASTSDPDFINLQTLGHIASDFNTRATINYGKTARIGITNSYCGNGVYDGTSLMQAQNNFYISNREEGNLSLSITGVGMQFNYTYQSIFLGNVVNNTNDAFVNVQKNGQNGIYTRAVNAGYYAFAAKAYNDQEDAILAFGANSHVPNFKVTGGGYVYGRRFITTLNPFPDYVFTPTYNLMTFTDLRLYIEQNKRLPKMPSAKEVDENGADIGEVNRLLVEKVEELTLYILQLEERINTLENK